MNNPVNKLIVIVPMALLSAPALAHPQAAAHGNLLHFLSQPDHVAALGLVVVAAVGLVALVRRGRRS